MKTNEVIQKIIADFPEIKEDIEHESGLFHMQISVFRDLAQDAIDTMNKKKFLQICDLVRFIFLNSGDYIKNALYVSFLENLNFQDAKKKNRRWAYAIAPKIIQEAHASIIKYNSELHGKMKKASKGIK